MILTSNLIDNFFDDSFAIRWMNKINYTDDVTHDDDGATIKMKVPGFNKKSIDISVDPETLTIEGKTDDDSFVKRFSIDNKFDFDSIDAKVVDGLLTLSIPYKAEVKPRKIKVSWWLKWLTFKVRNGRSSVNVRGSILTTIPNSKKIMVVI